jgi:transglutaminase-like putative cysteine protease
MFLRIDHATHYRYASPVGFTPHILRLIPRSTPGLRLLKSKIEITPTASVKWNLDLLGNIVGTATFPFTSDELLIRSSLLLEQQLTNAFDFLLEERALSLPFSYLERELPLLSPFLQILDPTASSLLPGWLATLINVPGTISSAQNPPDTLTTLLSLNSAIRSLFHYTPRMIEGTWSVEEILTRREGTCRDFAHLLIESARFLGIGARYVSGYLCSAPGTIAESHTHGWCELYLPGAGWRGFDPTNGILTDAHHIPVATSLSAGDIPPVEGSYCGESGLCLAQDVTITAQELLPGEEIGEA